MINTDASGQGSLLYGKTSDHVLGLRAVMLDGSLLDTAPMPVEVAEQLAQQKTRLDGFIRLFCNVAVTSVN